MLKSYNTVLQANTPTIICESKEDYELAVNSLSIFGGANGGYVTISIGDFSMQHSVSANARIVFPFFLGVTDRYPMTAISNNDDIRICVAAEEFFSDPIEPFTITAEEPGAAVRLYSTEVDIDNERVIKYKVSNSAEWVDYKKGTVITLANVGDTVKFKNKTDKWNSSRTERLRFNITKKFSVSGNIRSLVNYSNNLHESSFRNLFFNESNLIHARDLIIDGENVGSYCFAYMFSGCVNLITAPLCISVKKGGEGAFEGMLQGCSNIRKSPKIEITSLWRGCLRDMLNGCTMLNEIKVSFTDWKSSISATYAWVTGVPQFQSGTFYKPSALPLERGYNRIPNQWTVVNID